MNVWTPTGWQVAPAIGLSVVLLVVLAQLYVELRGEGRVSLAATGVLAVPVLFPPAVSLGILGLASAGNLVLWALRSRRGSPGASAVSYAGALAASFAVGHVNGLHEQSSLELRVVAAALVWGGVDIALRVKGRIGRLRSPLGESVIVHVCLACAATLLVVSSYAGGPLAGLVTLVPLGVLSVTYAAQTTARRTSEQTLDALATLAEVTARVPQGHAPRLLRWADALADDLGLPWEARERLRTACRLHHLAEVVDPTSIFERIGLDDRQIALVTATTRPARRRGADQLPALVRAACTFDTAAWAPDGTLGAGIVAVRAGHATGSEAVASEALLRVLDKHPELVGILAPVRRPVIQPA